MRENTGICVSTPRASRHSLGWKRVGTRSLDESVLNKTIREKESKRQTPAHLEFGLVNSHSSSFLWGPLRRAGRGKESWDARPFLQPRLTRLEGSGPTPTTRGEEGWREVRGVWAVLSIPGVKRGKVSAACHQNLSWLHTSATGTHTLSPWHNYRHPPTAHKVSQKVTWSHSLIPTVRHPVHSAANMQSQPHTHSPPMTQSQPHNHRFSTLPPSHTMSHKVIRTHTITVLHEDTHSAAHYHSHTPTTRISSHISTKSSAHGHRHNDTPTTGTDNHTRTHGAAQSRKVTIAHMESHTSCPLPQPNQLTQAWDSGPAQTVPSDPQGLTWKPSQAPET